MSGCGRSRGGSVRTNPIAIVREPQPPAASRAELTEVHIMLVISIVQQKGGVGKTTLAVNLAGELRSRSKRTVVVDADPQASAMAWAAPRRLGFEVKPELVTSGTSAQWVRNVLKQQADFVIIDTPGRDDPLARHAATMSDTLVTPMNDSFVDFDLIGQVESENFKVRKLSFYAELIWEARLKRSRTSIEQNRAQMDWVVVRNRTGYTEARNMARIEQALTEMSKRVGFRVAKGLSERVVYRELFPSGLTLLDKGHLGDLGTSHLVARQELRGLIATLRLPGSEAREKAAAAR